MHVLPSWVETCGLVTLEAAHQELQSLAAPLDTSEYLQNDAHYCDPADAESILRVRRCAMKAITARDAAA